ncbi:hypothetical protein DL766_000142 [Monosporascus sp. MC13-8B]|uniref:Uncharacterized protein n=1 Tax=Monosporascus cannonballus TaxID=155416 RepID=A0ABY0HEC2_9PEZI|nr:hypothetical protein DL762_002343 [Monosporascus cannonballus]RYO97461.1 hypothetical protein DL763_002729 [Monosporascus cannonballus]RYP40118.1 hypothetical protein DL766_000142 [Monosporascus sp. MC13-8B]
MLASSSTRYPHNPRSTTKLQAERTVISKNTTKLSRMSVLRKIKSLMDYEPSSVRRTFPGATATTTSTWSSPSLSDAAREERLHHPKLEPYDPKVGDGDWPQEWEAGWKDIEIGLAANLEYERFRGKRNFNLKGYRVLLVLGSRRTRDERRSIPTVMMLVNQDKEAPADGPANSAEKWDRFRSRSFEYMRSYLDVAGGENFGLEMMHWEMFHVRNKEFMEVFTENRYWSPRLADPEDWAEFYASLGLPSSEETMELRRTMRNRLREEAAAKVEKLGARIRELEERDLAKDVELTHLLCKISLLEVANGILETSSRNLRKVIQEGGQCNMISFFDEDQSDED